MIDLLNVALVGFTAATFVMMMWKDTAMWRLYFLVAYCTQIAITYAIEAHVLYLIFTDNKLGKDTCNKINDTEGFPNEQF